MCQVAKAPVGYFFLRFDSSCFKRHSGWNYVIKLFTGKDLYTHCHYAFKIIVKLNKIR